MVLKLHGHAIAPLVRQVAVVCKEKDIPYEVVDVDVKNGANKTPEFRKFHPFGQVPYADDDGFILYEARAICRYLVKKYEGQGTPGLIPKDLKGEALFEQAASVEYCNFYPFALGLATELIIKKHKGLPADQDKVKEYVDGLSAKLDVYNDILGRHAYLAGEEITLADILHLPYAAIVFEMLGYGNLFENRPHVERWWKAISLRPTWQAVKMRA